MRKILLLITFALAFLTSETFSQNNPSIAPSLSPSGAAKTTLTNVDTANITTPVLKTWYETLLISASIVKATGTLAGTAQLQATLDGIKWFTLSTTTLIDGTNDLIFTVTGTSANGYRVRILSSGTSTATISNTKFLFKRRV